MKKSVFYIVGAIVILAAIAAMLIFIFTGEDADIPNNKVKVDLKGTWQVVAMVQNDIPTFIEKEFMVFDDSKAYSYKNGEKEPALTSAYNVTEDNKLVFSDVSMDYVLDPKTANYVTLYENATKYLVLVKYANADMSEVTYNRENLIGKWDVTYRSVQEPMKEALEFSEVSLNYYRDGAKVETMTSSYAWKDDSFIFTADAWNKELIYREVSEDTIQFIETVSGFVWELKKAE